MDSKTTARAPYRKPEIRKAEVKLQSVTADVFTSGISG
jgi:hypothetical protein